MGIGDWGLGIGPNPQSPILDLLIKIISFNFPEKSYYLIKIILINKQYDKFRIEIIYLIYLLNKPHYFMQ